MIKRAQQEFSNLPIILVSGSAANDVSKLANMANDNIELLHKPFVAKELDAAIRGIVSRFGTRQSAGTRNVRIDVATRDSSKKTTERHRPRDTPTEDT